MNLSKLLEMPYIDGTPLEELYYCSAADFPMDQELDFDFALGPNLDTPQGGFPDSAAQQGSQQQWGGPPISGTGSQLHPGLTLTKPFEQQTLLVYSRQPLYQPYQPAPPQAAAQRQQLPPLAPAAAAVLQRGSSQSSGGGLDGGPPVWGSLGPSDGAPLKQGGERSADANGTRPAAKNSRSRGAAVRGSRTGVQKVRKVT